jgi:hypothetical protein
MSKPSEYEVAWCISDQARLETLVREHRANGYSQREALKLAKQDVKESESYGEDDGSRTLDADTLEEAQNLVKKLQEGGFYQVPPISIYQRYNIIDTTPTGFPVPWFSFTYQTREVERD